MEVWFHPQAMLPRVAVMPEGCRNGVPARLAIRTESLVDFIAAHDLPAEIRDRFGSRLRRASIAIENGFELLAVERLGWRHFCRVNRFLDLLLRLSQRKSFGELEIGTCETIADANQTRF